MSDRSAVQDTLCLDISHFREVYTYCFPLRANWDVLAVHLHIDKPTIDAINVEGKDLNDRLMKAIDTWLRRQSEKQPPPSWRLLWEAIANLDTSLSEKVAQEHKCTCTLCVRGIQHDSDTTQHTSVAMTSVTKYVSTLSVDDDSMMCTEPDKDKPWLGWRYLQNVDSDVMILSSYGDTVPPNVRVAEKLMPDDRTTADKLLLAREELDIILDLYRQDKTCHVQYHYTAHGELEMSRDYYLRRVRKFLEENDKQSAGLHYTGNSEEGTGNWCFKDGVVTFEEIYDIYIQCFKGKRLTIITDCSYSGNWVKECCKMYDSQGILSCGHHSREKGILFKVNASCMSYQKATIMAFVKKAMEIRVHSLLFYPNKILSTGQKSIYGNFRMIYCNNKPDEQCEYITPNKTWMNLVYLCHLVYLVRCNTKGKQAWHCVLVDEDKVQALKKKVSAGSIALTEYGKVLYSGWGEDPPQDIEDKINEQF